MAGEWTLIPATGTVEMLAFNMPDDSDYPTQLEIDGVLIEGQITWARPVVGLLIKGPTNPFALKDGHSLQTVELVVNEFGHVQPVHNYLHMVVGSAHWDCTASFYRPHINGPVTDAPRIRARNPAFCPCGCMKEVKPGIDCTGEPDAATA